MKKGNYFLILAIIFLLGWFYWFQWRPSNIRKDCYQFVRDRQVEAKNNNKSFSFKSADQYYRNCLILHGLKGEPLVTSVD